MASASTSSAGTINLPGLTSLNSKVDILAEITTELVGKMGDLVRKTLPSLEGAISTHSSDLNQFKYSTSKIIEGQSNALAAQQKVITAHNELLKENTATIVA